MDLPNSCLWLRRSKFLISYLFDTCPQTACCFQRGALKKQSKEIYVKYPNKSKSMSNLLFPYSRRAWSLSSDVKFPRREYAMCHPLAATSQTATMTSHWFVLWFNSISAFGMSMFSYSLVNVNFFCVRGQFLQVRYARNPSNAVVRTCQCVVTANPKRMA